MRSRTTLFKLSYNRVRGTPPAAQEAFQGLIEREASVDGPGPRHDEHETHEWPAGMPDGDFSKMPPVDLPFLVMESFP